MMCTGVSTNVYMYVCARVNGRKFCPVYVVEQRKNVRFILWTQLTVLRKWKTRYRRVSYRSGPSKDTYRKELRVLLDVGQLN